MGNTVPVLRTEDRIRRFSDGFDSHPPLPNNAGLAQQVEQLTCNEKVGSSILSGGRPKKIESFNFSFH